MNHTAPNDPVLGGIIGIVSAMIAIAFLCAFAAFVYFCCHKTSLLALLWFRCIGHRFYSRVELQELSEELERI